MSDVARLMTDLANDLEGLADRARRHAESMGVADPDVRARFMAQFMEVMLRDYVRDMRRLAEIHREHDDEVAA